jgi:acyl-CoA reductase-like NAD-dependent aldehyde dehydrogenase
VDHLCSWRRGILLGSSVLSAPLLGRAIEEQGAPQYLSQVLIGGADVGQALVDHGGVALLSATGSTCMGQAVGPRVADRFGRSLLELGGNNAAVVASSADLELTTRGIVFSAVGTAGQRCTTMRRVVAHASIVDELVDRLSGAYARLPIGNPLESGILVGPLVQASAYKAMQDCLEAATSAGGTLVVRGGRRFEPEAPRAFYAGPAIVRIAEQTEIVRQETFAPILYVMAYDSLKKAIAINNDVSQGLSSSIFTNEQSEAERSVSAEGSAGSATSTSGHLAPRSAGRSVARSRPWWARVRLGRLEELHAPGHQHHQLLRSAASGPRRRIHCLAPDWASLGVGMSASESLLAKVRRPPNLAARLGAISRVTDST